MRVCEIFSGVCDALLCSSLCVNSLHVLCLCLSSASVSSAHTWLERARTLSTSMSACSAFCCCLVSLQQLHAVPLQLRLHHGPSAGSLVLFTLLLPQSGCVSLVSTPLSQLSCLVDFCLLAFLVVLYPGLFVVIYSFPSIIFSSLSFILPTCVKLFWFLFASFT